MSGLWFPAYKRNFLLGGLPQISTTGYGVAIPAPRDNKEAQVGIIECTKGLELFVCLTQCCNLAIRHESKPKVNWLSFAPVNKLIKLDGRDPVENARLVEVLRKNPIVEYSGYYYFDFREPIFNWPSFGPSIEIEEGLLDFGQCFPVHNNLYQDLLACKMREVTSETRLRLKIKLGNYFARLADDEHDLDEYSRIQEELQLGAGLDS